MKAAVAVGMVFFIGVAAGQYGAQPMPLGESPEPPLVLVEKPLPPLSADDAKLFARIQGAIDNRFENRMAAVLQEAAASPDGKKLKGGTIAALLVGAISSIVKKLLGLILVGLVATIIGQLLWKYIVWIVLSVAAVALPAGWLSGRFASKRKTTNDQPPPAV